MTLFQLGLLVAAGVIFWLFFKQLFSGDYPKRGVDFEAKLPDEQIGGVSRPDKIFKKTETAAKPDRVEELIAIADDSVAKGDLLEARKAIESAAVLAPENPEVLRRQGYLAAEDRDYENAAEIYEKLLRIDPNDDQGHDALANVLHRLGKDEEAIAHHKKAIALDEGYAPYYFNYANTLYDLHRYDEAAALYKQAYECDPELTEAKEMYEKLEGKDE